MRIKAYGIKQRSGEAELFYYERNVGDNEVRVKIIYSAIARGDVQFISDDWGDTKFPLVPGHGEKEMINQLGAEFILSPNTHSLSALNKKFDFIISTLNVEYGMDAFLEILKPRGKFCVVATPFEKSIYYRRVVI